MNLSERELKAIKDYIDQNAYEELSHGAKRAPILTILEPWRRAKSEYLYKLLGENLMLTKEISFQKSQNEFLLEFSVLTDEFYEFTHSVARELPSLFIKKGFIQQCEYYDYLWQLNQFFTSEVLYTNKTNLAIDLPQLDGKRFKLQVGSKAMRALAKIVELYDLDTDTFERFRLKHSTILNQKEFTGTLTLSIHPLDYMTMSDNWSDWTSCMSWRDNGCYRAGTVEMMNSPCTLVAYLASSNDMALLDYDPTNFRWNNKKWRNLFVVDKKFISSIKGYPYQQEDLTRLIVSWIAELATENLGWEYDGRTYEYKHGDYIEDTHTYISFYNNGWMYNDFGSCMHYCTLAPTFRDTRLRYCYGGTANCMYCGKELVSDSETNLVCDSCFGGNTCVHCGCHVDEDNCTWIGDDCVCEDCLSEYYTYDLIADEWINYDDSIEIHLFDENDEEIGTINTYDRIWKHRPKTWSNLFDVSEPHLKESTNPYVGTIYVVYESELATSRAKNLFS